MSINIPIKKSQMNFATHSSHVQLVLKVESSEAMSDLMNYFTKTVACLHLRLKNDTNLEYMKNIHHFTIPSELTNLHDIQQFTALNFTPPYNEAFGTLATNEKNKIIALNASHRFCDGGFFKFLLNHYNNKYFPKNTPILPKFSSDIFKEEIQNSPDLTPFVNDPKITRFHPSKLPSNTEINKMNKFESLYNINNNYNYGKNVVDPKDHQFKYYQSYDIRMTASEFSTFNKSKNAPRELTKLMWLSQYFAASAYQNKPFDSFKIGTIVDLRPNLPNKPNFLNCYHCGQIAAYAPSISLNEKLSDFGKRLQQNLLDQRKNNAQFSLFKWSVNPNAIIPGIALGYSAVGAMNIQRPIVDAYVGIIMGAPKAKSPQTVCDALNLFNWSVSNKSENRNDFITQVWYNPNVFDYNEISHYGRRVEYFIRNISLNQTVGEVYDIIKKVQ